MEWRRLNRPFVNVTLPIPNPPLLRFFPTFRRILVSSNSIRKITSAGVGGRPRVLLFWAALTHGLLNDLTI